MSQFATERYPRSTPYQKPAAAPHAAWNTGRKRLIVITVGVGLLVLGVASGALFAARAAMSSPPPAVPDTAARTPHDRMLETLGSLSGAHLYQSYLNIGLLADAVEKEAYTTEQATAMLATVVSLMNEVDKQLDKLAKMDLSNEDKQDVERIRNLSSLMRSEVAALRTFWRTGEEQHARRYHEAREKAWEALSEALGL